MLRNGDSHYGRPGTFQLEKDILEVEEEPPVPAQSALKAFDIRLPSSHHLRRAQGTGSIACSITEGEISREIGYGDISVILLKKFHGHLSGQNFMSVFLELFYLVLSMKLTSRVFIYG